ncbi:hypothetical protein EXZ61_06205 [Rhodoferax aquaticus]|uniref:FecR protein domain-containing protein n=2 Tax=Rhodoferax aquaticus TaxID=2527691 RepID=A0A515EVI4_9BURK|nr:hypothetical protein EXZ61_06205 [Rhodoferax aquaticus]
MQIHRPLWRALGLVALALAPILSQAQQAAPEPVGYVKTVTGEAWVSTQGARVKAEPGTAILMGSRLKTEKESSLGVTFKDNTVMSFGPTTELTVDEYLYAPAQNSLRLDVSLIKGTLNYISGVIAKLRPEAVSVKTPAGIIGVRGTQFVARVEEAQ